MINYRGYEIVFSPDDGGYYAELYLNGIEYYSPRVYRTREAINRDIRKGSIKMEPRHQLVIPDWYQNRKKVAK